MMTFQFLSTFDDCKFSLIYVYIRIISVRKQHTQSVYIYTLVELIIYARAQTLSHFNPRVFFSSRSLSCILYVCVCVSIGKGLKSKASKMRRSNRIRGDKMESWNLNEMDQKKTHEEKR